ncbi:hypothetical protein UA08_08984 [Talaromyces atroroseus]|uniref:Polyketide synthase-like phosphopantetheine-binding domain-containing protein n=1 Tax=Talaromyces atroroseus TaxID=1441469 RepID=A0A1Q5Q7E2_TALAT|nr:hypothetical protein UA08_08984 [Talaromyces atroroseus]OKL55660.1 hypothetical protein UA08_08984 [Talaromyces atroroseus]
MAAIVRITASETFHGKQATIVRHREVAKLERESEPETTDSLIRRRAKLLGDTPLMYYLHSGIEYVGYSIRQLDVFAYRVAQKLCSRLPARTSSSQKPIVVSILGPSDLNYLVMFWGLSKLGHSVLFLSTRISLEAYVSLLERAESKCIVIDKEYQNTADDLSGRTPGFQVDYIAQEDWYNFPIEDDEQIDTNLTPTLDPVQEAKYVFYGAPYALKILAETEEGIQALARFKLVLFSGSPCPDSLGDKLVANGVHLISQYGSTETGHLMTSERPREDKLWDSVRPSEALKPFLRFEEKSPGLYESVVLDGWPSKVTSNRPDGSYATEDLFTKHPDLEGYKYCARLDDITMLVNGKKVIPLALEGSVRQDPAVAEVVVFGAQRDSIGMIVILTEDGAALSRDQLNDQIWPRVEKAQTEMSAFGQLSREMVVLLPPDTQYPRTDKGTVIRQAVYRTFADLIKNTYNDQATGELLCLTEPELKEFLQEQLQIILSSRARSLLNEDADFFNIGMDSLQTTQLRSIIIRRIDRGGKELGLNLAFDHPSINVLAKYLLSLRSGVSGDSQSVEDGMKILIEKYSVFQQHEPLPNGLHGRCVVLTVASGSLGSHTAAKLALRT